MAVSLEDLRRKLVGDLAPTGSGPSRYPPGEGVAMKAPSALFASMSQHVARDVDLTTCREACRTLATAAFSPSLGIRSDHLGAAPGRDCARNSIPHVSASEAPIAMTSNSRWPSVNGDRDDDCDGDDPLLLGDLHIGRVEPEVRPVAPNQSAEEGHDLVVELRARAG